MKCPSCGAASDGDAAPECPACGLIFAKWRERQEKEKREALEAVQSLEIAPKALPKNPWVGRGIAIAVVLVWIAGLSFLVSRRSRRARPAPIGQDTGDFVEVRDPQTGDVHRMPIRRLRGPAGAPISGQ
jgi:hypothetical protein